MDIQETAANPADEGTVAPAEATEAPESTEAQTPAEGEVAEDGDQSETDLTDLLEQAEGTAEDNPDAVEIEFEGKTYKVPPELKDGFLRHADYTKKTMEIAETRKAVEATKAELEQISSMTEERFNIRAEVLRLGEVLKAAEEADARGEYNNLSPEEQREVRAEYRDLKARLKELEALHDTKLQEEQELRGQQFAKVRETALKEAAKRIPNFDDARRAQLDSFVQSLGGQAGAIAELADPVAWELVHLAHIGKQFVERTRQAKQVKAAQDVQPAIETGGKKAPAGKPDLVRDADKMSIDEWNKQREAQLAKQARR